MIEMSTDSFQQAIATHFPELPIRSISLFGEGWANRLCLVNKSFIFRFPLDAHSEQQLLREISLLPVLAPELPLQIPNYQYIAPASDVYPYPFVGYPLIPGNSFQQAPISLRQATWWRPAAGEFISALHRISIDKVVAVGLNGYQTAHVWRDALASKHELFEQYVFPLLDSSLRQSITHYLRTAIKDVRMVLFSPVVIHQDFDFHNLLIDLESKQVTGVVDFGCCSIGDPLLDISPELQPYYHGKIDPGWDYRRDYYHRTSALEDLLYIRTCEHSLPDGDAAKYKKLIEISRIWSS